MNEEIIVVQSPEEAEDKITIEDVELDVEQSSTVEYIDIEEPEEVVIKIEEAVGWTGGNGNITHSNLPDKDEPGQHTIESITNLRNELNYLGSARDIYSINSGYAEFRPWKDKNPDQDDRLGYFVSLVNNNDNNEWIEICNSESNDVYGVVVSNSGFCGKQLSTNNILSEESVDRANDYEWAKVCLLGTVTVRFGESQQKFIDLKPGDFVIPDNTGCAKKSENGIGFKVITKEAKGIGENAWNKVSISLVPQNDNVARVMKVVENTNQSLGDLQIQIGDLDEKVNTNITISGDFEELKEEFTKLNSNVSNSLDASKEALETAQEISNDAIARMETMTTNYHEAMEQTGIAQDRAEYALGQIGQHQNNLSILSQYRDNIVGFFAEASEDEVSYGTIAQTQSDVSMIKQTSKDLQNLVCHVDVYSVGKQSPTAGLSYESAQNALGEYEYIYVPTINHTEHSPIYICTYALKQGTWYRFQINDSTYYFQCPKSYTSARLRFDSNAKQLTIDNINVDIQEDVETGVSMYKITFIPEKSIEFKVRDVDEDASLGNSYIWSKTENNDEFWWTEVSESVIHTADQMPFGDYGLWYTKSGVKDRDGKNFVYNPGTLYRKTESGWIAVATINDKNARTMSYIHQTADEISSTITNVAGDVSVIRQDVNSIEATVSEVNGQLSTVKQNADSIIAGTYNGNENASELAIVLNSISSTVSNTSNTLVGKIQGQPSNITNRYSEKPTWDGDKYVFSGTPSADGEYCLNPNNPQQYYKLGDDEYEVYIMGAQAITSLQQQVDENSSRIDSFTGFDTATNETLALLFQESDADGAQIGSVVMGEYRERTKISLEPIEDENILGQRYAEPPKWVKVADNKKCCTYDGMTSVTNGAFCIPTNSDGSYYYKLLLDESNEIVGYEKYELKASGYATIMQKVDENGASIGFAVGTKDADGRIFVDAINDQTSVLIDADKIGINGFTVFRDNLADGTTTISGNYIKTGVLTSNNYSGPVTYKMYGAKIGTKDGNKIITTGDIDECIYYTPIVDGEMSIDEGYYYASEIKSDVRLYTTKQTTEGENKSHYIVSSTDFELIPSDIEFEGTKFDLNVGTIVSKNLFLDGSTGDLTIAGRINATSGYIGNESNGFSIGCVGRLIHKVGDDTGVLETSDNKESVLPTGKYYFEYNGEYYTFSTTKDIPVNNIIAVSLEELKMSTTDGMAYSVIIYSKKPAGATRLSCNYTDYYSLLNNQWAYIGDSTYNPGVYIGPDGIGLGNGNFYVTKSGNLVTNGTITMKSNGEDVVKIQDGNLGLAGNITLGGSITLGGNINITGSIAWSDANKPIKVLYKATSATAAPTQAIYNAATNSTTTWHKVCQTTDYYASYSYDGGQNWTIPIKIRSGDGDDTNGVTKDEVFAMLTNGGYKQGIFPFYTEGKENAVSEASVYINASYIKSGILQGVQVISESEYEDGGTHKVDINEGRIHLIASNGDTKLRIGYATESANHEPYMMFGAGTGENINDGTGIPFTSGAATMYKTSGAFNIHFWDTSGEDHCISFFDTNTSFGAGIEINSKEKVSLNAPNIIFVNGDKSIFTISDETTTISNSSQITLNAPCVKFQYNERTVTMSQAEKGFEINLKVSETVNHCISLGDYGAEYGGDILIKSSNEIILDAPLIVFSNGNSTPEISGIDLVAKFG